MKFSFNKILLFLVTIVIILPCFYSRSVIWEAEEHTIQGVNAPVSVLKEEKVITYNIGLEDLAQAIREYEGYYLNSVSDRNNNPGNLRYSVYQDGMRDGFAYFSTYELGWKALLHQLTIAADGRSNVYHPEMNLYEFFNVYAPSFANSPDLYAENVIKQLGIDPDMKLKEFIHKFSL